MTKIVEVEIKLTTRSLVIGLYSTRGTSYIRSERRKLRLVVILTVEGLLHVGALHHGDLYVEHRTADRLHGRCQDDILSTGNWDVH